MSPAPPRASLLPTALLAVAGTAIAFRLWTSLCFFPLAEWNNVRLAPTFLLVHGPTPYPALGEGPLTTWIYGPVTLLANLPALLGSDAVAALLIAGLIGILLAAIPAACAVNAATRALPGAAAADRFGALLLCLALWPNTSLQYIQADNTAVAFGLLSNLLLARTPDARRAPLVAAAACCALAVWSKQTSLGLVAAQLLWLGVARGLRPALRYAAVCAACGVGLGLAFVAWFGWDGLWTNLVRVPGSLPLIADVAGRTRDVSVQLGLYVLIPAAGLIAYRRTIWRRDSPWLLPALTWVGLLPFALTSTYKIGGAPNSLNSVLYLLPSAAVAAAVRLRHLESGSLRLPWLALATLALTFQQLASAPVLPLQPLSAHLVQAEELARTHPGKIYFPWHPLVTYYAERRLDHVEDGFTTREFAGFTIDPVAARRHLPPNWSLTALPGWRENDRGVTRRLMPADARLEIIGKWSVYVWSPHRPAAGPP